ncbi:sugar phosphate isomerase/epimerase family protein [Oceaniglobus trochenteri]|uniref:sugar phosphate isomerase/epimerase family protein n=1 Tax=Oceaniglobus trochenteri TaxID=2763260 RepID=UPI001CFF72DC|nr:sugar phosphate isomerase/epimerase family protein [Oceaniglobus trochenteri]
MKLAYSTLACPDWTWQQCIDAAVDYGYDGIEWRLVDGEVVNPDFPEGKAREIAAAVAAAGLKTCALDSGIKLTIPPGGDRDRMLADCKRMLDLARAFGAEELRVFPGAYPESVSDDDARTWLGQSLDALDDAAVAAGVRISLELHDMFDWRRRELRGTTTSSLTTAVLKANPDRRGVGILWDIGNPYMEGENATETWENIEGSRHLSLVHIKDFDQTGDKLKYRLMGQGEAPLDRIIGNIRESDYDGWISFEWEKKWQPDIEEPEIALPHFVRYMRGL